MQDRYGLELSTQSAAARDAYAEAMDIMLAGDAGAEHVLAKALAADPDFSLAQAALARQQQYLGDGRAAREAMKKALEMPPPSTDRERSHLNAMDLLIRGRMPDGYQAIRAHLKTYPRDALLAQTCTGVFSLIGFSGLQGRESEQLAFTSSLEDAYGDDWWFLGQHAFSQVEAGQIATADRNIDRALSGNPRSAHNAHIRAHVDYEAGSLADGLERLSAWLPGLDNAAIMFCHVNWHVALWSLETGDEARMWSVYDAGVAPSAIWGPPINVITDSVALLYRAQLAGVDVPPERWADLSAYARERFPRAGLAFVDVHAALAHAMSGDSDGLDGIIENAAGPAADVVQAMANAFRSMAGGDWDAAIGSLSGVMATHERIGGSRAQRDLIEFCMAEAMRRSGKTDEARRLLAMRRPIHEPSRVVAGL